MRARLRAKSIPTVRLSFQIFIPIRIRRFLRGWRRMWGKLVHPRACQAYGSSGDLQFISLPRIGNFLHGLPVTVTCLEIHPGIQLCRVLVEGNIDQT